MSRQFYIADETADIILSDFKGRLDQITEITSDTVALCKKLFSFHRLGATLFLTHRGSLDPDHIVYGLLRGSSDARQERLRSKRPFVQAT